jgi:hypothetical protein
MKSAFLIVKEYITEEHSEDVANHIFKEFDSVNEDGKKTGLAAIPKILLDKLPEAITISKEEIAEQAAEWERTRKFLKEMETLFHSVPGQYFLIVNEDGSLGASPGPTGFWCCKSAESDEEKLQKEKGCEAAKRWIQHHYGDSFTSKAYRSYYKSKLNDVDRIRLNEVIYIRNIAEQIRGNAFFGMM